MVSSMVSCRSKFKKMEPVTASAGNNGPVYSFDDKLLQTVIPSKLI